MTCIARRIASTRRSSSTSIASLLDATNVRALVTAAQIHAAAGRDESAVKLLRRAVALEPRISRRATRSVAR